MKLHCVHLILAVSGWTVCHGLTQKQTSDRIYFSENRPRTESNRPSERTTTVVIEKSVEPPNQPDSYSVQGLQSYNPYSLEALYQNANAGNRQDIPNTNFQPPIHNRQNVNYYNRYRENEAAKVPIKDEVPKEEQVPLASFPEEPLLNNVSLAITNFGVKLLRSINNGGRNLVVSPFSIAELLALLHQGAYGLTQQQITQALEMTPESSMTAFRTINERFQKGNSRNILRVANNVYVADAFDLNPAFKKVAIQSFGSEVTPISFLRSVEAVQKINKWVSDKTNNKIPELLRDDAVGENTQTVLVNAVYFKGLWAIKFKPESTTNRDFHVNEATKKTVPFMHIRKIFKSGIDPSNNAQVVILPFENDQYSLMVVVPSPVFTLDALVASMTDAQLAAYHTFTPKEVDLEIPKFTIRANTDLNQPLRNMGVTNIFGQQAELSGLGTYRAYSPQVSSALHTALLAIDEEGGSAAAATAFAVVALSYDDPSLVIKANKPFLAVLWDNASSIPLFMAKIQDPAP